MTQKPFVMSLRIGGIEMALTRHSCTDLMPADRTVCYIDKGEGRLVVAIYKAGEWRDRYGKPYAILPLHWFQIGAAN